MRTPLLLLVVLLHSGPSWLASGATSLPRAVIHIGPHKTSTTYIQSLVCTHEAQLEEHGWTLPVCAQCGQHRCSVKVFAHVAWQYFNNEIKWSCAVDALTCFRGALSKAAAAGRNVLVSAEDFSPLSGDRLKLLAESFQGFNVSVVIYVRSALSKLLSRYFQNQKGFSRFAPEPLSHYFLRIAMHQGGDGHDFLDEGYGGLLTRWAAAFGEEALHLVSHEGVMAAGLDPFQVLWERVMGLPPVGINTTSNDMASSPGRNPGLPSRVVAATSFLVHFVRMRSDRSSGLDFRCATRFAAQQLQSVLPIKCKPFAGWVAALNAREKEAVAGAAKGAHRYCFEHEPEASPLPEACEVDYPEVFRRWEQLLPHVRDVAATAVAACPENAMAKPLWFVKGLEKE